MRYRDTICDHDLSATRFKFMDTPEEPGVTAGASKAQKTLQKKEQEAALEDAYAEQEARGAGHVSPSASGRKMPTRTAAVVASLAVADLYHQQNTKDDDFLGGNTMKTATGAGGRSLRASTRAQHAQQHDTDHGIMFEDHDHSAEAGLSDLHYIAAPARDDPVERARQLSRVLRALLPHSRPLFVDIKTKGALEVAFQALVGREGPQPEYGAAWFQYVRTLLDWCHRAVGKGPGQPAASSAVRKVGNEVTIDRHLLRNLGT